MPGPRVTLVAVTVAAVVTAVLRCGIEPGGVRVSVKLLCSAAFLRVLRARTGCRDTLDREARP